METCHRGDTEHGVSGIIPPQRLQPPSHAGDPQGWGYSIPSLREGKLRHGTMLVSSQGSALGRLEILPGVCWGRTLRLVWEGCGLRGGEQGPGPRGVSCSMSRFLPAPLRAMAFR